MKDSYIFLLGGVPGVGKTSISGHIARELGINIVISGDYVREGLRPFFPEDDVINMSVYDSWKRFGENNVTNLIKGFNEQGGMVNKSTSRIIKRAISNGEPMIIETLYFIPDDFRELLPDMCSAYLYIGDRELHVNRLNQRQDFTHFNSPGSRLSQNITNYRHIMDYSIQESDKYGIRKFDNENYLQTRDSLLEYARERMVKW